MDERYRAILHTLLRQVGGRPGAATVTPLSGDGSDRPFFRLAMGGQSYLAALSSPTLAQGRAEAHAAYRIGRHLHQAGLPVPTIHAYDEASGAILFQDLGDRLLFHAFHDSDAGAWLDLYRQAVTTLADFQLRGREGFRTEWCWDTPRYDTELMLGRESHYFAREFCANFVGLPSLPAGLAEEFVTLAERNAQVPADYLIHRDYQSRNLMVKAGELTVIDFQGARLGPLAYDLASLLNDPYVTLAESHKRELLQVYLQRLGQYISLDQQGFMEEYHHIALQRNLQVLGAYSFLDKARGKAFFRQYITPALERLVRLLTTTLAGHYPVLQGLVAQIAAGWQGVAHYRPRLGDPS